MTAGRCPEAIDDFTTLEAAPAFRKGINSLAIVRIRKGDCLLALDRRQEAEASLEEGLAGLASTSPAYDGDRRVAHLDLGKLAYFAFDYPSARRQFELAAEGADSVDRIEQGLWLTRVTLFDSDTTAITQAKATLALAKATAATPKRTLADLQTLYARALLNHGRTADAYGQLKEALQQQGGLTLKVDASMLVTRSDLAIAALLYHDQEAARKYLGYTAAGRSTKTFASAASMETPACGGPAGLKPDDVAIVEFGVNDNGSIKYAEPIYASRNGAAAVEFARAVSKWSWRPADAAVLPPLFRLLTRVEVRCTDAPERPSLLGLLWPDVSAWLEAKHISLAEVAAADAETLPAERAQLAKAEAMESGVALLSPLLSLAHNTVADVSERRRWLLQARQVVAVAGAVPAVRAYMEISIAELSEHRRFEGSKTARVYYDPTGDLRALLEDVKFGMDAKASNAVRLTLVDGDWVSQAEAATLLNQVVDDKRLAPRDPLRVAALLRLSSLEARTGDLGAARTAYQQTGLEAQQCALVDARPSLSQRPDTGNAFPQEAQRWGFEGWVKTEYDIAPDGKTLNQRAIVAYPPFVFRDAAIGVAKTMRFTQTYRPEGGPGCSGAETQIKFLLPEHAEK